MWQPDRRAPLDARLDLREVRSLLEQLCQEAQLDLAESWVRVDRRSIAKP
jgi:hypothetical protein